jgi:UDP:flavonoid glycosyltransferase YjiC (YdhE family)
LVWILGLLTWAKKSASRRKSRQLGARFCLGDWGVRLEAPEIALAAKSIDWRTLQNAKDRIYLQARSGPRKEFEDSQWSVGIDAERPLIYCSLGALIQEGIWKDRTQRLLRSGPLKWKRYLDVVIDAAKSRPHWQLVVAAGHLDDAFDPHTLPGNVRVLRWVPQDDVLSRADVMLTAGGSSTVQDCLFFGVPMIVVPLWSDHYGNAARVVAHKVGYSAGDFKKMTAARLTGLIERILVDSEVASSLTEHRRITQLAADESLAELGELVHRCAGEVPGRGSGKVL